MAPRNSGSHSRIVLNRTRLLWRVKRYEHLAGTQAKETPASETNHDSKKQGETSNDGPEIGLAYCDLLNATSI